VTSLEMCDGFVAVLGRSVAFGGIDASTMAAWHVVSKKQRRARETLLYRRR